MLSSADFSKVIENTPLVSIDLVVKNEFGEVLLGRRLNRPAKGFLFVPGGRILKDESFAKAFQRLTLSELGQEFSKDECEYLGHYDHFYDDNLFNSEFSTHYLAIAYQIKLNSKLNYLPFDIQHDRYVWLTINELLNQKNVHTNTKLYFS